MVAKIKAVRLVSGFTIDDVAEACRSAALEFLDGVRDGWGKRELAAWLVGPYHQLSLLRCSADELAFSEIVDHAPKSSSLKSSSPKSVADCEVEKTMRDAREEVLKIIRRFAAGDAAAETFVWRVRNRGALARVEDETGAIGLVPNEAPTQRLVERILSLIAADYVARPLDFEDRVAICATCKSVTFDHGARDSGACSAHRSSTNGSGVRSRVELRDIDMSNSDLPERDSERLRALLVEDLRTG